MSLPHGHTPLYVTTSPTGYIHFYPMEDVIIQTQCVVMCWWNIVHGNYINMNSSCISLWKSFRLGCKYVLELRMGLSTWNYMYITMHCSCKSLMSFQIVIEDVIALCVYLLKLREYLEVHFMWTSVLLTEKSIMSRPTSYIVNKLVSGMLSHCCYVHTQHKHIHVYTVSHT